ncbi:hypothetical protein OEA41_003561 [Lepraria neglecta]|uniref:Uncharacterized protein n=1 Tax=Lepraria neglecta TaxID=209136 RepID=A0AAE0DIH3_9LECA|nr:hypothetical protein OEA41_003561 [Lepraria neglecta]
MEPKSSGKRSPDASEHASNTKLPTAGPPSTPGKKPWKDLKTHQTESIDKSQAAQLQMNVVDRNDDALPPNSATSNPLEMPVLQNFPGNENQMNTQSPSRQLKSSTPSAPKIASESFEDLKGKIKED